MAKRKKKLMEELDEYIPEIMFGIMSGTGLFFIVTALSLIIKIYLVSSNALSFVVFSILFLSILVLTSVLYARGGFRIAYLTSALILFLTAICVKIFEEI